MLDIDGVIGDFNRKATEIVGIPYPPNKWHWYKDAPDGFNILNNACTFDFWKNLGWIHDGHDIFRLVTSLFNPENIFLLTTPMPNVESASGKMAWIYGNLPEYKRRTIIITASKALLAKPNVLLIDDRDKNVDEFRAAGGNAILVPRPWNRLYELAGETYQCVKAELEGSYL